MSLTPKATEKQLRARAKETNVNYEGFLRGWKLVMKESGNPRLKPKVVTKVKQENK